MIPLAILAGGLGTRLGALAQGRPKSLVEAAGVPFLDYQLAWAVTQGVRRVVLCLGYRAAPIRRYVRSGGRWGMEIRCSDEGRRPLGTAEALRRALRLLGRRFLVLYGDSYLPIDYSWVERAQRRSGLPALMVIYRNRGRFERSNVAPRHGGVARYVPGGGSGLSWVDAGLAVLTPEALGAWPHAGLAALYRDLAADGRLACVRARRRFHEVGSPAGLAEFRVKASAIRRSGGW